MDFAGFQNELLTANNSKAETKNPARQPFKFYSCLNQPYLNKGANSDDL